MHLLAGSVIRQSLIPMLAGYLVVMVPLALALLRLQRVGPAALARPETRAARPETPARPETHAARRGWLALLRHAAITALGGYLLLVAVEIGYYYGIAKVGGDFLASAVTGPALLIGLAAPVFAAASWLSVRRARRRFRGSPGGSANDPTRGSANDPTQGSASDPASAAGHDASVRDDGNANR